MGIHGTPGMPGLNGLIGRKVKYAKPLHIQIFQKKKKFNFSYYFRETKEMQEPVELMEILEKKEKK